uniref:hypothetical protein n=1 Tax=Roseivirga sp. TaxID=1964215 RepID=UPI004048DC65
MGKKTKRYEIDNFEKLLNLANEENIGRISIDMVQWLHYYTKVINAVRTEHPKETEGKTNWEISQASFIWIDDGATDMKGVSITNTLTGEVVTHNFRKK